MSTITICEPAAPANAAVIVLQEAFGVNQHIRSILFRLRDSGYTALAPHLFEEAGDPEIPYTDTDAAIAAAGTVRKEKLLADVDECLAYLERKGVSASAVGLVGFCMGGSAALAVACYRDLGAAVTFYGGGIVKGRFGFGPLVDEVRSLRAPWLGCYGDLDPTIPSSDIAALREALSFVDRPTEIVRYDRAGHGFHCDARDSYEPDSAKDAWGRTMVWFGRHLSPA
jgi:carboxymethylenebutenolidase